MNNLRWDQVKNISQAIENIDKINLMNKKDINLLKKRLVKEDQAQLIKMYAKKISLNNFTKNQLDVITENFLMLILHTYEENLLQDFIQELADQEYKYSYLKITEILLKHIPIAEKEADQISEIAIITICELALFIKEKEKNIFIKISSYLLSISNSNSNNTRLTLFRFFSITSHFGNNIEGLNKVILRFGHTIFDQLFHLLFTKKTEGVALSYIYQTFPQIFLSNKGNQKILYESLKHYLLINSEQTTLFLKLFAKELEKKWLHEPLIILGFSYQIINLLNLAKNVKKTDAAKELMLIFKDFYQNTHKLLEENNELEYHLDKIIYNISFDLNSQNKNLKKQKKGRKPTLSPLYSKNYLWQSYFLCDNFQ